MDEDEFWAIVMATRSAASDQIAGQAEALREALGRGPIDDVVGFRRMLDFVLTRSDNNDLGHAGGLLLGGISDDSFMDFRTWLVCHGRETYERALADPDAIVDLPYSEDGNDFGFAEKFVYVADEVYELRTGADVPDEDMDEDVDGDMDGADFEFDLYDEATLRARFPRLWERAERLHPKYLEQREEMYRRLHPERP